jgi:hypothetical protein
MLRKAAILMCLLVSAGLTQSQLILMENPTTYILIILSSFGCTFDCGAPDLNGDGLVAANGILQALSTFGVACPE